MKIKLFKNVSNINFNLEQFPNSNRLLLVTGLSGSGKSYLSKELAKEYNAIIFQVEWLKHSKHISNDCKYILDSFIKKYPEIEEEVKNKWKSKKSEDKNKLFKKYINLFFLHFLEIKDSSQNYIVEGLQLFTLLDFDLIKDYPLIIKGTSSFNSLKNRFKRDYEKRKKEKLFVKIKFIFRVIRESFLYQFKHRKTLNKFIKKKENCYE